MRRFVPETVARVVRPSSPSEKRGGRSASPRGSPPTDERHSESTAGISLTLLPSPGSQLANSGPRGAHAPETLHLRLKRLPCSRQVKARSLGFNLSLMARYNGAPRQELLIIRRHPETGRPTMSPAPWGLIHNSFSDKDPPTQQPINARAETVKTKFPFAVGELSSSSSGAHMATARASFVSRNPPRSRAR